MMLVIATSSLAQTSTYRLTQQSDSLVKLFSKFLPVPERVILLESLKNRQVTNRIKKLQDQLARTRNNERLELELNLDLGRESKWLENIQDSYKYFTRSLYLAEKLQDENAIAVACLEIGNNIRLGNLIQRPYEDYFVRAVSILETFTDPLSTSYALYAKLLLENDEDKRLSYAEEAVKLLKVDLNLSDTLRLESLAKHLNVEGLYSVGEKKIEKFKEGLAVAKAIGNSQLQALILNNMGYDFVLKEEYDKAIPYHLEALDVSIQAGLKGLASNSFNNLSVCYTEKSMYKEALEYYQGFFYIQSDLNNDKYFQDLAEVQVSHEVDRVELQNELLLTEQNLQLKQRLTLIIITILLCVIVVFIVWSRNRINKTNERLRALDKAKSRFFANISHELRTPLTLINAPLESLIHSGKIKDEEVCQTIETATRNGQSLLSLVEEILDLAKLDGGKLTLVENPVRINECLKIILSDYKAGLDLKSIKLNYSFLPQADLAMLIDENKCTKIINNLLSNALKFTPEGGSISVKVEENAELGLLTVKVEDTGVGIHSEDLPFVFDRYFQSGQANKKAEGGTGIGLALAKELAILQGGNLIAQSEEGKGSIFTLTIPLRKVAQETVFTPNVNNTEELTNALNVAVTNYSKKFEIEKPVLLVTEDHPEMRSFIAKTLSPFFEIKQAENGKVALEILKSQSIDIVISDVMMPVMDGFELLEVMKKDKSLHSVSVVMLTARADHEDKLYALTLGIDDYLTKPFSSTEFLARIKNILENRIKIIRKLAKGETQFDISELAKKYDLVEREVEVLELMSKRYTNPEIADALFISRNTVKFHIKNIFSKLGISSRLEALEIVKPLID